MIERIRQLEFAALLMCIGYLLGFLHFHFQIDGLKSELHTLKDETVSECRQEFQRTYQVVNQQLVDSIQVYVKERDVAEVYAYIVEYFARQHGLNPFFVHKIIVTESSYRSWVESPVGALGLMQVDPKWWGHETKLRDPVWNLKVGTSILRYYLDLHDLHTALHKYSGGAKNYPNKISTWCESTGLCVDIFYNDLYGGSG